MSRTKTEFRALRELVGITQQALADELGVQVRSVKRWEHPDAPQHAPQDAWDVLDEAMREQRSAIWAALSIVDDVTEKMGEEPRAVRLPYWASQEQYDAHAQESLMGMLGLAGGESYRMADATLRAIAAVLMSEGIEVEWSESEILPRDLSISADMPE